MGSIKWKDKELRKAIGEAAKPRIESKTDEIKASAAAMSAGYKTAKVHKPEGTVGGTKPKYAGNVRMFKQLPVGLVYTGNYAAMKDNHENNTLLKAMG